MSICLYQILAGRCSPSESISFGALPREKIEQGGCALIPDSERMNAGGLLLRQISRLETA